MDDTFNNSSMAGKIVSILIALLFIVVLAFPIANSLGNTDSGGSGGESEKVVLNTEGLSPYSSIQIYSSSITPTLPSELTYTLTDLEEIKQNLSGATDVFSTILSATNYSTPESDTRLWMNYEEYNHNDIFIQIHDPSISGLEKVTQLNELTSFNLTISPNYLLSIDYTTSNNDSFSLEVPITLIYFPSNAEYGWWMTDESSYGKVAVGSQLLFDGYMESGVEKCIYVTLSENMFSENHLSFTIDWGDGDTSDIELEIQSTDTEGIWQLTGNDWGDRYSVKDNQGNEYANADAGLYAITNYYSLPSSDSDSGSGSGSGTSVDGIAGTLIKLVPILMIIGLLMIFIIPMVHKPN